MGFNEIPVLNGGFAPIDSELTLELTDIEGEIPKDLTGMYVRNGPNRRFEAPGRYHWFDGDGMLHAVRFEHGRAVYQNRWVMTDSLQEEINAGGALWQGIKDPPTQGPARYADQEHLQHRHQVLCRQSALNVVLGWLGLPVPARRLVNHRKARTRPAPARPANLGTFQGR